MSDILLVEQAASATPSAGQVVIYPKADGLLYSKDDAGVETGVSTALSLLLTGGTLTGALNEAGFTVAAHATTTDIWTGGNFATLTGAVVTFTDVADAPVAGATRWVRSNAAHVLTSNAAITVHGGTQTIADGTLMFWHALTTTTFEVWVWVEETAFTDYSATSTITGWSSFTTKQIFYTKIGKKVTVAWNLIGTSNATGGTFTLPYANNSNIGFLYPSSYAIDNGGAAENGLVQISTGSSTMILSRNIAGNNWTATGDKQSKGSFMFVIN